MSDAFDQCQQLVRAKDPERFVAALFADQAHRPALMALYAFHFELARVREVVRDPMPGEIRLQWWRDLLTGTGHGDVHGHPVADALLQTIDLYRLPREPLIAMTEAHVFDLYDDPMPDLATFVGYAGDTHGALFKLATQVLAGGGDPGTSALSAHAGVAEAVASVLRALPHHLRRGQVFLPEDLLARHGTSAADILAGEKHPGVRATARDLAELAVRHLGFARDVGGTVPIAVCPAFLGLALVPEMLKHVSDESYDPWTSELALPRLTVLWRLWRGARRMRAQEADKTVPLEACFSR